jgi:hypothetical protein
VLMKVETHNHPTAISPFPGASTGAGGEIRDEGATGRGSKPKAGLTGFSELVEKVVRLRPVFEATLAALESEASPLVERRPVSFGQRNALGGMSYG